jgi:hypothetical protein
MSPSSAAKRFSDLAVVLLTEPEQATRREPVQARLYRTDHLGLVTESRHCLGDLSLRCSLHAFDPLLNLGQI